MFRELEDFSSLAWDFDDTLIGHSKSPLFWRFISDNPYGQRHSIVTMRSHGLDRLIFQELDKLGSALNRSDFEHVISLPNRIYESYMSDKDRGAIDHDHDYHLFKGMHCAEIGAQALIDDMEANAVSQRGCDIYGIAHFHPDDLG